MAQSPFQRRFPLPDEPGRNSITESPKKEGAIIGPDQLNAPRSVQPSPWGRPDRIRLLIWVGIAFILPAPFIIALHLSAKSTGVLFSIQSELPIKAITAFFVVLATWIVSRKEKRPLSDYGIPPHQTFHRRFWEGTAWGFAMLSGILLLLCASGHFRIDSVALTGGAVFQYGVGWAAVFLAVAVTEEFEYRGYLLFSLSRRMRFWPAALSTSVVFGIAHLGNPGENALGILQIVATGLLFCLTIRRTGNLWFAVGFHAAWDWAETFFYGTPDSARIGIGRFLNTSTQGPTWLTGGSVGPEGSVIVFFVLLLCALLVHFRFPKTIYPNRPI
jgi:membrane protease YdiL (CAAX protease family)